MKGGSIIGGLLGSSLVAKGVQSIGGSLLNSFVNTLSGEGKGGGKGSGKGGGKGGNNRGGSGDNNVVSEILQQAIQQLRSNSNAKNDGSNFENNQDSAKTIDVEAADVTLGQPGNTQAALELLNSCIVSYLPGRVRLRHAALKQDTAFLELQKALKEAGFSQVEFKTSTGSALLTWENEDWNRSTFLAKTLPLGLYLLKSEGR